MQTLQYLYSEPNSYIHTTHTINYFFFKTIDVSVVSWIQDILSVLMYVILHNDLFHHATLWIPLTHLPTSLKYFCLRLSLILYQLVGHFKCNYLTQPILDHTYMIIVIPFTSIKNMTKRSYPLTNPPSYTLPLTIPWIIFNALMYLVCTILAARD